MIWVYRLVFLPVLLVSLPYYLKRMFKRGGYKKSFHHRFGLMPKRKPSQNKCIWIQAVSIGEVKAIQPLIQKFSENKNLEVFLTTTTSTAYAIAQDLYKDLVVGMGVFPLDFWPFSYKAWNRIKPDVALLMEGELWPEHMHQAHRRNVPLLLVNARLSDRTYSRYKKVSFFARFLANKLSRVLVSNQQDLDRFLELGVSKGSIELTGNIKFDVPPKVVLGENEKFLLKQEMGFLGGDESRAPLILLGSSTWAGEEAVLLKILNSAIEKGIDVRLLIVPRHPERKGELLQLMKHQSLMYHFRSEGRQAPNGCQIYVGDTVGELSVLTQVADIAFVGKSLPPHIGGQTPIEAAALGLSLLYGPEMSNFKLFAQELDHKNAAIRVSSPEELEDRILELLVDVAKRKELSENSISCYEANRGATERTFQAISRYLIVLYEN